MSSPRIFNTEIISVESNPPICDNIQFGTAVEIINSQIPNIDLTIIMQSGSQCRRLVIALLDIRDYIYYITLIPHCDYIQIKPCQKNQQPKPYDFIVHVYDELGQWKRTCYSYCSTMKILMSLTN